MRSALLPACVGFALVSGCAHSLVADGRVREQPFAEIVTRTAAARGDPRPEAVDVRVVRPEEVPGIVRASIEREWTPEALARYQEGLVSVGLWPPEHDLVAETLRVGQEEIAGLYDPDLRALFVVEGVSVPFSVRLLSMLLSRDVVHETALTHEVVHLLQHRAEPALFEELRWKGQDDATGAFQAATEGDATYFGLLAMLPVPPSEGAAYLPDPETFRSDLERGLERSSGALAEAPALIRLTLAFPYAQGYALSYAEGTRLLSDPPISTEQVIHPEQRRASFQAVDLAALAAELPPGCRRVAENTLGELGVSVLFQDLAGEPAGSAVAAGWDGDRYLAVRCGERRALLWWTGWDSESDAEEFAFAYAGIAEAVGARAELGAPPRAVRDGASVVVASEELEALRAALPALARRSRVASLAELRAHVEGAARP